MKNIDEFLVGRSGGVNNAGWLSGSAVVYKIKLQNDILYVEGIDKNKKKVSEAKTDIKNIKAVGTEYDDIYYIDLGSKTISMHVVEQNKKNVEYLLNTLKEYGISDNSKSVGNRKKLLFSVYSLVIILLGVWIFLAQ